MSSQIQLPPRILGAIKANNLPTPYYLYDQVGIKQTASSLSMALSNIGFDYQNYFAVKANPNPHILDILREEGMGADASSGPELELARMADMTGEAVMFTANNVDPEEYREAYEQGAIINLDDINQIEVLRSALGSEFPETISFRYNPGSSRKAGHNSIIGRPEDSKFGLPEHDLIEAYQLASKYGAKHFGIHTMLVSNELDVAQHIDTARILFSKVAELAQAGIGIKFVNLGGGLGVAYHPDQKPIDYKALSSGLESVYREMILDKGLPPLRIMTENGRHITGPHGYLVTQVRSVKLGYEGRRFVGVDATMADLMRPGMYDAYHGIEVLNPEGRRIVDQAVVGSLCENNDYFTGKDTKYRPLPEMKAGDIVVIRDAGAHSHAMGFNYNGKLRAGEYLLEPDGEIKMIRRPQTREDYFATLSW